MDADFTIGAGDTLPALAVTAEDENGVPIPLTGCTAEFILRDAAQATWLAQPAVVVDPVAGTLRYDWLVTDTAVPGSYLGQFQVTFPTGGVLSVPTGGYIAVTITPQLDSPTAPRASGTSTADLMQRVRQITDGPTRPLFNQLASGVDGSIDTVTLKYDTAVVEGQRLSVDLETMYVWSWDQATKTAKVLRGADGSVPSSHGTAGLVRVNPRFTDYEVFRAINEAIDGLASRLWTPKVLLRTINPVTHIYDLAADMQSDQLLEIAYSPSSPVEAWVTLTRGDVIQNVAVTDYPSGNALVLVDKAEPARPLRITYRARLGRLESLADDVVESTGLPQTALDLPAIGGALNLLMGSAVWRADTTGQPGSRRSAEVTTSDATQSVTLLRVSYQQRVAEELDRLTQQWPWRMRTKVM